MDQVGRTAEVIAKMKQCKLTILGLYEIRWKRFDKRNRNTGETILLSDLTEKNAPLNEGVAMVLSKEAEKKINRVESR